MRDTPVLVILLILLLAVAFAVTFFGVRMAGIWLPQQVCDILVYEVDPEFSGVRTPKLMGQLLSAISDRLNPGMVRRAIVAESGDGKIEVRILGSDPQMATRIRRLLDSPVTLEFRILANRPDHEKTVNIEQAISSEADDVHDEDGNLVARWVPVRPGFDAYERTIGYTPPGSEVITRMKRQGSRQITQALVVQDGSDIGTEHLEKADARADYEGTTWSIDFKLTPEGGRRLAALTGRNLPNFMQDHYRKLGIILDGRLCSAEVIQQPIESTGTINGNFTREEAADLITNLNAGPLPVKIRYLTSRKPQPTRTPRRNR